MSRFNEVLAFLLSQANPGNVSGMARAGINPDNTLGIKIPVLRELAKTNRKNHDLAIELWKSGIHEARILASMVDDPKKLTVKQMEEWVKDFDSWDVCDQVIMNLFEKRLDLSYPKAFEWVERQPEFEKRAGFVLIARFAVSDKKAENEKFLQFFEVLRAGSADPRNFVKKAVNWAIRQIGKRNDVLIEHATRLSNELLETGNKTAVWIAKDALREFDLIKEKERGR